MRRARSTSILLLLLVTLGASSPAFAVQGRWFTSAADALAAARSARKPILAVAMDHG